MSKRAFDEISDDEWEGHTFTTSRVFSAARRRNPPPPIESFTYRPASSTPVIDLDADDEPPRPPPRSRTRRLVVDDDSDFDFEEKNAGKEEEEEEVGCGLSDGEWDVLLEEVRREEEEAEEEKELDLVGKALQKCERISAELKRELYGSAAHDCERYAEVDESCARIVTQDDIDVACGGGKTEFQPILKPYQIVGVNFLLLLYRKNVGGAILADEMGLGKTVQAATYLTLLRHLDNDPGPHLIVCPASLLENWERELRRWCPSFSVILFHGSGKSNYSKELNLRRKAGLPPPFNVLLVCYSLFERRSAQQKDDRKVLKHWQWSCVLLDEAHALKDKNSYRWKSLMSVAQNARQRLMLTGTPLQNDLHELWSLLEFMMPDIFSTGDDSKKLLNADDGDLISRIKSILGPFILRRMKFDVMQQLVPKIQRVEYVEMEGKQAETYQEAINDYRVASQNGMEKFLGTGSNKSVMPKSQISNYFMQLRKIANHPLLVRHIYTDDDAAHFARLLYPRGIFGFECNLERVIQEIKSYNDFEIHRLLLSYRDGVGALKDEDVLGSAKCQVLAKLLPSLKKDGHKVLIFSQWTSMLDILEWTLEVIGVTYRRLDGSTQVLERQAIVDAFNNDPSIFACLLSTRAGGQGFNLIGADTVIIHDMDFNPQVDRQAEDRCHRIGQVKPVTIYRLVTRNTVDENIYGIAQRKLVLDAAVLENCGQTSDGRDVPEKTMGEILSSLLLV